VDKGDFYTLIGGFAVILVVAMIANPNSFAGMPTLPFQKATPTETPVVSPSLTPVMQNPITQTGAYTNQTLTQLPTTSPTPLLPTGIYYSSRALNAPRTILPDHMETFGASDVIPWHEQELIHYAYLEESRGGITKEFTVPYDVSVINVTTVANRQPTYAILRMVVCDAKNGTILTGVEIFHSGNAQKILLKPENNVYIIVGAQYVDQFQITFETPQNYQEKVSSIVQPEKPLMVSGVSTRQLETKPTERILDYIVRGRNDHIEYQMYGGVSDYLSGSLPPLNIDGQTYISQLGNNDIQNYYLSDLIQKIRAKTDNKDDQARISISLVQQLYYNTTKETLLKNGSISGYINYPYITIYSDYGVCTDKSVLLAYLLKDLGYGVVLFSYQEEKHMAVGIKSPAAYAYKNTGYAYIEATCPNVPTDVHPSIKSDPIIIPISDGASFDSIYQEYFDAQTIAHLDAIGAQNLLAKYGMVQVYPKEVCQ